MEDLVVNRNGVLATADTPFSFTLIESKSKFKCFRDLVSNMRSMRDCK